MHVLNYILKIMIISQKVLSINLMKFQNVNSKLLGLVFTFLIIFLLNSCGPFKYQPVDVKDSPINDADMRKRNIEEGRGFSIPVGKNAGGGNFNFANANELWRATLDILEFTPLSNVDYTGGIIITDWYSSDNNLDQSIKISVQFLTEEIRADGILVKIYERKCQTISSCKVNMLESELNQEIKLAILKKAAQIKAGDLKKKRKEKGEVRIPKNSKDQNRD
tara:strand:- start:18 stop:680 length:663 start_codon:yes stop_codon:yes gene_type:complete